VASSYRDGTSQTRPNTNSPFSFWTWLPNELKNRSNNESQLFGSLIQVKRSMSSNINNKINNQGDSSSSGSSTFVRVIPGNQLTEASSSDSEPEPSTEERERRCVIKVRLETQLSRDCTQARGVRVRLLQSNLHGVRIYTPEDIEQKQESCNPNEDTIRIWSPENCVPWKFEMETQERDPVNPLKRPASRPGSPQQEAGGPREASRRLCRQN